MTKKIKIAKREKVVTTNKRPEFQIPRQQSLWYEKEGNNEEGKSVRQSLGKKEKKEYRMCSREPKPFIASYRIPRNKGKSKSSSERNNQKKKRER